MVTTSVDAAVCPNGRILDRKYRLDPAEYGTHSLGRRKASLIYLRTMNLREVRRLIGHTMLESTIRYLGIEVDDVLEIAERIEN